MTAEVSKSTTCEVALHHAAAWRLIGLLLERPRAGWVEEVRALAAELDDAQLRQAAAAAGQATEGAHLMLFGEGGFVSPREVTYRPEDDPGQVLADIASFFEAFAHRPRAEDPIDHVAVEAGFVGYLHLKEALALAAGDAEAAQVCAEGQRRFCGEHLCHFGGAWIDRLRSAAQEHLALAGEALVRRLTQMGSLR